MSSTLDPATAQLISAYSSATHGYWLQIGAVALLAYEYVITLNQEVALFWKPKITGATVLFMGTRYSALLSNNVLLATSFARLSDRSCAAVVKAQYATNSLQYPFWAAFSGLRVLALSGMNQPLAVVVFILALAPFAVNIWPLALHRISGKDVPILGCEGLEDVTFGQGLISVVVSRGCLIVADMLVVIVTWASWRRTRSASSAVLRADVPTLSSVLMYNDTHLPSTGTIYFLVVVICNMLHLILTVISFATPYEQASVVTSLTDPLTTILVCRFLLDLQRANQSMLGRSSVRPDRLDGEALSGQHTTLRFASGVIGSISQSITMVDDEHDFDELDDCEMDCLEGQAEKDLSSRIGVPWEGAKGPEDDAESQSMRREDADRAVAIAQVGRTEERSVSTREPA